LAAVLVVVIMLVFSLLAFSSVSKRFIFSKELAVREVADSFDNPYEPNYNFTDSSNYVGNLFFRMERDFYNNSENKVYIDIQHVRTTELDSIVFLFKSPNLASVFLDTNYPLGVTYVFSRSFDTFTIEATNLGGLGVIGGTAEAGNIFFNFVLKSGPSHSNSLLFSAELSMHYMTPLQLTSMKASISLNTNIPSYVN